MIEEQQDKLRRTKKKEKFMKGFEKGRVCSDYLLQYGNEEEFESNSEAFTNFIELMRSGIPDEFCYNSFAMVYKALSKYPPAFSPHLFLPVPPPLPPLCPLHWPPGSGIFQLSTRT